MTPEVTGVPDPGAHSAPSAASMRPTTPPTSPAPTGTTSAPGTSPEQAAPDHYAPRTQGDGATRITFASWMTLRGLSRRTIKEYCILERLLPAEHTQEAINLFFSEHNYPLARAFARLYLHDYLQKKHLEIPSQRGRKKKRIPVYVSKQEFDKLQENLDIPPAPRLMMAFCFIAGLRADELVRLRQEDIDFDRLRIRGIGKGNKEFYQKITTKLAEFTRKYILDRHIEPNTLLFDVSSTTATRLVKAACVKTLGKPYTLHKFRHGHATYLRSKGLDLKTIQHSMRHADITSTSIYTHIEEKTLDDELNNALGGL